MGRGEERLAAGRTEYARKKHVDAGTFPSSGAARIEAIDAMLKQDKAYDVVRERIAAEKDGGAKK